jgi:hypothetical protein
VGLAVGDRLGLAVGLAVGDRLGLAVGLAVGLSVGDRLGLPVLPPTCAFSKKILQIIIIHLFLLKEDVRKGGSNIMLL